MTGIGIVSMYSAMALRVGSVLMGNRVLVSDHRSLVWTHLHMRQTGSGLQNTALQRKSQEGRTELTAETHAADKTDVDNVMVAETDRSEVDRFLRRDSEGGLAK